MTFYSFLDHIPFLPPKLLTRIKARPSASPSTVPIRNTTWSSDGGHRNHLCMPGVNERPGKKWLGIVQYEKDETGVLKWGGWLTEFIANIAFCNLLKIQVQRDWRQVHMDCCFCEFFWGRDMNIQNSAIYCFHWAD